MEKERRWRNEWRSNEEGESAAKGEGQGNREEGEKRGKKCQQNLRTLEKLSHSVHPFSLLYHCFAIYLV